MPTAAQSIAAKEAIAHYTRRAPDYDQGSNGWHIALGEQYVSDINPPPGARCLDLACGTGLVTFPLARRAGPLGLVIGVDLTPAMLEIARRRPAEEGAAEMVLLQGDIADLEGLKEIDDVRRDGGFDVITCCSALVLLADPATAIKSWAGLLKEGGKFITDVPTETHTLQYLFSWELRGAMGLRNEFDRSWVKDVHSVENLCVDAGLVVERSWRTGSQGGQDKEYRLEDGEMVFEEQVKKYQDFMDLDKLDVMKVRFLEMWRRECARGGGMFRDGHWLYVTIARKP